MENKTHSVDFHMAPWYTFEVNFAVQNWNRPSETMLRWTSCWETCNYLLHTVLPLSLRLWTFVYQYFVMHQMGHIIWARYLLPAFYLLFYFWWQGRGSVCALYFIPLNCVLLLFQNIPFLNSSSFLILPCVSLLHPLSQPPSLHSLPLSLHSTSAPSHHVNYTTLLFLYYSPRCKFCHPSHGCACLCYITSVFCQGLQWLSKWGGGEGACTGAQFNNKWLLSVIWLAQIRGLLVLVRRWLLQRTRWLHCCCCLSAADWDVCLKCVLWHFASIKCNWIYEDRKN